MWGISAGPHPINLPSCRLIPHAHHTVAVLCRAYLQLDQALADAMSSSVGLAQSSSQAPHAALHLSTHAGVAAQGGEEVFGRGRQLVGLHKPNTVWHC